MSPDAEDTATTDDDTAAPAAPPERRKGRSRAAVALLIVGSLLLPIAGLSFWARNQVLDTGRYVDTVAPLATDPAVQAAVADRLSAAVVAATDIEARAAEALPERASFLAAPIAAGMQRVVHDLALQLLASDEFARLWTEVNRIAHTQVVALLEGTDTGAVERDDGQIVVTLEPIAERLLDRVDEIVPIDLSSIDTERLDVSFVLVDSDDLARVQSLIEVFNKLAWLLVALAIAALVAAVFVAPDRRRGLQRVGVGIVVSMSVTLLLYAVVRERYLTNLAAQAANPDAAAAVFDTLTRRIQQGLRTLLVFGAVLWGGAWVAGPSPSAARLRARWNSTLGRGGDAEPTWVGSHATELRSAIVGLAALVLLVWDRPTGKVVLLLTLLVVLGLAVVQLLGGSKPAEAEA